MKVSAIVTTNRMGGMDLLLESLRWQTLEDSELVLIDTLYDKRKTQVSEYASRLGISSRLRHLPPPIKTEWNDAIECINLGIEKAEGELIVFSNDYVSFDKKNFEAFWDAYCDTKCAYLGGYRWVEAPL